MLRVKQTLSLLSLLSLTVSCVKPPDIFMCRELNQKVVITKDDFGIEDMVLTPNPVCLKEINESRCGFCIKTISNEARYIGEDKNYYLDGKPWSEVRTSAILMPVDSFAKIKEFIINSCKKHKDCNDDIDQWRSKFDGFQK